MSALGDLSLSFKRDGEHVVVSLGGEFDAANAQECQDRLSDLIDGQGNRSLRFQLRELEFIDSSGLHVLARTMREVRERGGDIELCDPRPGVRRALDISGLSLAVPVTITARNDTTSSAPARR